ncbi:hypothetical protein GJ629_02350 [Halapricum sp. CBA1109]|uniref:DUF7541 family protein n=1 Tax=Halapricum sp. CBA1109 TaxID=2668068 RepID=UPI0012F97A7A|nr:hypothetical protein [Halapricum sp. CBA1109]MUV88878.1 hypothetical protein [Halapricum sp. CBA1109]
MAEQADVGDRFPTASPWPLFVAVGFTVTELGLFIGIFPVAVAGVLLFGASVAGILTEAEYVGHLWKTMGVFGAVLAAIGLAMVVYGGGVGVEAALGAIDAPNVVGNRLVSRGLAVGAAGIILAVTAATGELLEPAR